MALAKFRAKFDASFLDTTDLEKVVTELEKGQFSTCRWRRFGLKAGIYKTTLDEIEANKTTVKDRFVECLFFWLKRGDGVDKQGKPSWRRLAEILEQIEERPMADMIRGRKELSSDVHKKQQVCPASTPGDSICLPEYLEDEYLKMTTEFASILKRFVNRVCKEKDTLKDVKISLIGIRPSNKKEIDEVHDESGLIYVLRSYCSLRKFPILTSLAKDMNMDDIKEDLDQFEKKRKGFYKKILAKDFARSAIKYCGTMNSREMTFEVLWPIDKATLDDFEQFLTAAFCSEDINLLIHLKTVYNSLLKFVCIIPHWLVDEIKVCILENKDIFLSNEVYKVTVNGTIAFNMKHVLEAYQLENKVKEIKSLQNKEKAEDCTNQNYTQEDRISGEVYACLMFYEKDSFISVTAVPAKMLTAFLKYIKDHHQFAEIGPIHYFYFKKSNGFIELNFNKKPPPGWTIVPLIKPCRLYQEDIVAFDGSDGSIPSCCFLSFQGSPDAVPTLHYSVSLKGVTAPVTLFIHRTLKNTASPAASYTGLVYYEKKEEEHSIIFTAAKNNSITTALNSIEKQYPLARINQLITFDFNSNYDHIELIFDACQNQSFTGWTIEPHSTKLYKNQVDTFSFTKNPKAPSCLVSIYESPDAIPILDYSVSLEGVAEPKTIDLLLKSPMTSSQVSYIGLSYYEWKGKEYLMTFTASKKLNNLFEYIEEHHPLAEISQVYNFSFSPSCGFIELLFDDSCKGWTIQPLVEPCRLHQDDIDRFDEADYPLPPSCLISIYGSPDADPMLHYSIPLGGVVDPVILCINRKLQLEKDILELFASHEANFKEEMHKKEEEMTIMKKSLEKQSTIAKEKQEIAEKMLALIEEQKLLEQMGSHDKEKKWLEQVLKSQSQGTKVILDTSKQQQVVEDKDKIIADLMEENTLLLEELSKHKDEKEFKSFIMQLKDIKSSSEILSSQEKVSTKSRVIPVQETISSGLIYYENKDIEDLATFIAGRDLNDLLEYIKKYHPQAEIGQNVSFKFHSSSDYIELKIDTPQKYPFNGWTIKPHLVPCRLYRSDINNFGSKDYPLPPSCLISVYGSPHAVPTLHYSIPLEGVVHPVTLFIHKSQRTIHPSLTSPTTFSSNLVYELTSVSSTGGANPSATVDVNQVKKVIDDVLVSHNADLNSLPKEGLFEFATHLCTAKLISSKLIISDAIREAPAMEECIAEFKASLNFKRKLPQVEEHCQKFLSSFIAVRGSYADAAIALAEDWIEAINELGFDFNINIPVDANI